MRPGPGAEESQLPDLPLYERLMGLHAIQHAYQAVAGHETVYTPPEPTRTFRAPERQASRQIELEAEP